jgi:hypothetical protein
MEVARVLIVLIALPMPEMWLRWFLPPGPAVPADDRGRCRAGGVRRQGSFADREHPVLRDLALRDHLRAPWIGVTVIASALVEIVTACPALSAEMFEDPPDRV